MLVSSIVRFNALNAMNNASFASMQNANKLNKHTFGGEHDLCMLNKLDNKLSLDMVSNNLLYKVAYLQEKIVAKHLSDKHSLNLTA